MSPALSHFIGNASSGNTTSVQGKENETQLQCRPIPDEFPHQELGKTVPVKNSFSTSSTSVSHSDPRNFPQYFYNCSVNVPNHYTSRWVWTLSPWKHCSRGFALTKQPVKLQLLYSQFSWNLRRFWFFIQLFARQCPYHVVLAPGGYITFRSFS